MITQRHGPLRGMAHRALVIPGANEAADNAPLCSVSFQLSRRVGAGAITDARFGTDPCSVARFVATAVIRKTG